MEWPTIFLAAPYVETICFSFDSLEFEQSQLRFRFDKFWGAQYGHMISTTSAPFNYMSSLFSEIYMYIQEYSVISSSLLKRLCKCTSSTGSTLFLPLRISITIDNRTIELYLFSDN